jgi:protein-tyrosine phosphatase
MKTTKLLFVCLGNICRSPAAEGVMRHLVVREGLDERIECDSAGTYGGHAGELPDMRMRRAASARGYDLHHRARQIRTEDFDRHDMIVVMDDSNYERVHRLAPTTDAAQKIYRMTDFCRRGPDAPHPDATHVPDPYYEGAEGFERVLDLLEDACGGLLERLKS